MDNIEKNIKKYELAVVFKEEADYEMIRGLVLKAGFEISLEGETRKMYLAYPINKETSAFFNFVQFMGDAEMIADFSKDLKLNPKVLRHLIVTNPIEKQMDQFSFDSRPRRGQRQNFSEKPSDISVIEKKQQTVVTNEDLEKKLEEILK